MDTFSLFRDKILELRALRQGKLTEDCEERLLDELDVIWARMTEEERDRTNAKGWLDVTAPDNASGPGAKEDP